MHIADTHAAGKLWWDAMRGRWSLRRAAGESRWHLIMHTARWLQLFPRQNRWLRALDARGTMQQAAKADPRLYERWHQPYISTHFDLDARRQIVSAHYAFMMQRFPEALCESIVRGHSVRLASLWLEDVSRVYLHLGKPTRAEAGELKLSLLTQDKEVLASCVLTFDRCDSLIIGAVRGAGPHTPFAARNTFIRSSHGLPPRDLLVSLVQALATTLGLKRLRAVSTSASIACAAQDAVDGSNDAFWQEHGALPTDAGCLALPLRPVAANRTEDSGNPPERQQQRELFRRQACDIFVAAFSKRAATNVSSSMEENILEASLSARSRSLGSSTPASQQGSLLAANR